MGWCLLPSAYVLDWILGKCEQRGLVLEPSWMLFACGLAAINLLAVWVGLLGFRAISDSLWDGDADVRASLSDAVFHEKLVNMSNGTADSANTSMVLQVLNTVANKYASPVRVLDMHIELRMTAVSAVWCIMRGIVACVIGFLTLIAAIMHSMVHMPWSSTFVIVLVAMMLS